MKLLWFGLVLLDRMELFGTLQIINACAPMLIENGVSNCAPLFLPHDLVYKQPQVS